MTLTDGRPAPRHMALVLPPANLEHLSEGGLTDVENFFHLALDLLCICTAEGNFKQVNPAWTEVLGYRTDELVGQSFVSLVHADDLATTASEVVSLRAGVPAVAFENRYRCEDGSYRSLLWNVARLPDKGLLYAVARDITSRKSAEGKFESLLEAAPDAMVGVDQGGAIRFVNRQTERVFGYDRAELVGQPIETLVPESVRLAHPAHRAGYLADPRTRPMGLGLTLTGRRRDGSEFPVDISLSSIETEDGLLVTAAVRDVTERDHADQELQRMAAIIRNSDDAIVSKTLVGASTITHDVTGASQAIGSARSMIESSLDSLVAISPEGMITDVNEATVKVTGIPRLELIGTAFSDYFTEPEKANRIYQLVFDEGMAVDYALTMRHRDGTLTEVLYNASVYRDAGGKVLGVFAAARDVTNQINAQYARSLIEAALDPLVTISPEGKITDVNQATVKVTGVPREELIGTDFSDYFTQPDKANKGYQQVFALGSVTDYPLSMRHRDGTLTEVLYNASLYRDTTGNVLGVFAAARDVTEQKHAQAELAKASKELDRLSELERFQRLTIGRELKMIELKKEIEYLKRRFPVDEGEPGDGAPPPAR